MAHASYILIMCIISFLSISCAEVEKVTAPIPSDKKEVESVSVLTAGQEVAAKAPSSSFAEASADKSADRPEEKRKITINNTIVKKDLGYYKCWMTHYPSEFHVHVNGKKLDSKEQIVIDEPRLNVMYSYEWSSPLGKVKKSKTLVYDIDQKTEKIDLSFTSWKEDEPRIKAPGCSLVAVTEVEEANTIPKEQLNQFIAQAGNNK
jgi:hypothetical protein